LPFINSYCLPDAGKRPDIRILFHWIACFQFSDSIKEQIQKLIAYFSVQDKPLCGYAALPWTLSEVSPFQG
jgi:hypothetical protein